MNPPLILTAIAATLTIFGVALLTWLDSQLSGAMVISRLNEVGAEHQSFANGLFVLIGIFWIGAIDRTRRDLEPAAMDPWLRYSAMGFAASYLLSMVFPCDEGCTIGGSVSQWLHITLVWALYFGPAVFAARCLMTGAKGLERWLSLGLIALLIVLHVELLVTDWFPGGWQRLYDVFFCLLWWLVARRLTMPAASKT